MANVESQLIRIRNAIYGEEVRDSIHDAINDINEESTAAKNYCEEVAQNESARVTAENTRVTNETARQNAETIRATDEVARQIAEVTRQTLYSQVQTKVNNGEFKGESGVEISDTEPTDPDINVWIDLDDETLNGMQTVTDNDLATTAKTIVGAINELKSRLDNIDAGNF